MKKIFFLLVLVSVCSYSQAKENPGKTFLVIFDKEELKLVKSSAAHIELNFMDTFETRAYTGNSESAILITVPFEDWSACDLGQSLVNVGKDQLVNLEEIAFRIIDMDASQQSFKTMLSTSEDPKLQKRNTIKLSL